MLMIGQRKKDVPVLGLLISAEEQNRVNKGEVSKGCTSTSGFTQLPESCRGEKRQAEDLSFRLSAGKYVTVGRNPNVVYLYNLVFHILA